MSPLGVGPESPTLAESTSVLGNQQPAECLARVSVAASRARVIWSLAHHRVCRIDVVKVAQDMLLLKIRKYILQGLRVQHPLDPTL
jgi:hypothetical protein